MDLLPEAVGVKNLPGEEDRIDLWSTRLAKKGQSQIILHLFYETVTEEP